MKYEQKLDVQVRTQEEQAVPDNGTVPSKDALCFS